MRRVIATATAVGLFLLAGCGGDGGPKKYTVSGAVQYKGQPLAGGSIDFIPEDGDMAKQAGTSIKDGKYEFSGANGLQPGKYKVSISGGFSGEAPNPSGEEKGGRPPVVDIPERYNAKTTLRAEVTADGKNQFDFTDLK